MAQDALRNVSCLIRDESGQAAAIVAMFFFFVFLAFAALGVDGSAIYLTRRDLQNVADASALAACRTLADGGDATAALNAALNTVYTNLQSYDEVGGNPPTNVGSGVGLLKGIELSDPYVRVALQRPAPTVLTQFVGRTETIITAQARCNSHAGGGLLPIAVQRYDGEPGGTLIDHVAKKSAVTSNVFYSDTSSLVIWNGRYGPFPVPVPTPPWVASPGDVASLNTGPEVVLLGQGADTNNGEAEMRGLVLLDVRNVGSGNALEYYGGADGQADGQANTDKVMSQGYISRHGYPGRWPEVGSQVGMLAGVSNNFAAGAMRDAYYEGDEVAVIVYDGNVWTTPDYSIELNPMPGNPDGIASVRPVDSSTAVSYIVNIAKAGPQAWNTPLDFNLTFDFTHQPLGSLPPGMQMTLDGTPFTPGVSTSVTGVTDAGRDLTLRIWNTEPITTVPQYLSGLNLIADSSLGATRGASSNFGFGTIDTADYTARSNSGRLVVRQASNNNALSLITHGFGSAFSTGCTVPVRVDILLNGSVGSWTSYFSSGQITSMQIEFGADKPLPNNFTLDALAGALITPAGFSHALRFTVPDVATTCNGQPVPERSVTVPLTILPPASDTTKRFVIVQGYAVFRISRFEPNPNNPNAVYGYAISPLYSSSDDIDFGLRARLVPWD